jgi:hypothetical protein
MTKEEAIAFAESKWWESVPLKDAAHYQLFEDRMVMPFALFQQGVEELLGRPVWTHEFAFAKDKGGLREQAQGKATAPTMQQILELIPEEKRIVVAVPDKT